MQLGDNLQKQIAEFIAKNPDKTLKFFPNPAGIVFPNSELRLDGVQEEFSVLTLPSDFTGPLPSSLQNTHLTLTVTPSAPSAAEKHTGTVKAAAAAAVTLSVGGWPWPAIIEDDDDYDPHIPIVDEEINQMVGRKNTENIDDESVPELRSSNLAVKLVIEADNEGKGAAAAVAGSMVETADEGAPPATSNSLDFEEHGGDWANTTLSGDKPPANGMEVISLSFTPPPAYKVWVLPPAVVDGGDKPHSNNAINLALTLHDKSQIEFSFNLLYDDPLNVAQEMETLGLIPYDAGPDAVCKISTAIDDAVQEARMKLNQGMLAYDATVYDSLARKLAEASDTISDRGNLKSPFVARRTRWAES